MITRCAHDRTLIHRLLSKTRGDDATTPCRVGVVPQSRTHLPVHSWRARWNFHFLSYIPIHTGWKAPMDFLVSNLIDHREKSGERSLLIGLVSRFVHPRSRNFRIPRPVKVIRTMLGRVGYSAEFLPYTLHGKSRQKSNDQSHFFVVNFFHPFR